MIRCIACGRPMERRCLRSGAAYWRCPELCSVREDGPLGAYYEHNEAIRLRLRWPEDRMRLAIFRPERG